MERRRRFLRALPHDGRPPARWAFLPRRLDRLHEPKALRFWFCLLVAYLVFVFALLALGGPIEAPSPTDIGWSD